MNSLSDFFYYFARKYRGSIPRFLRAFYSLLLCPQLFNTTSYSHFSRFLILYIV